MSAPNTNLKTQKKRHKAPLFGMGGVVIGALLILALLAIYVVFSGNEPDAEADDAAGVVTETQ